jgi:hypothetical protein
LNDGPSTLRNLSARFPPPTPSNAGSANAAPLKSKTTQMSDWSRAPLSDAQIAYAAQDAIQSEVVLRGLHERWGAPLGVSVEDFCAFFADATSVGDLIASDAKLLAPGFNPCAALTMYRARNVLRRIGSFYIARYVAKMNALDDDDPADAVVKKTTEWETLNRICFLWGADLSVHAATEVNGGIDGGDGGGGGDDARRGNGREPRGRGGRAAPRDRSPEAIADRVGGDAREARDGGGRREARAPRRGKRSRARGERGGGGGAAARRGRGGGVARGGGRRDDARARGREGARGRGEG